MRVIGTTIDKLFITIDSNDMIVVAACADVFINIFNRCLSLYPREEKVQDRAFGICTLYFSEEEMFFLECLLVDGKKSFLIEDQELIDTIRKVSILFL